MDYELKHKWHVDRSAWFIRLYVWLWLASESDINFCKLFWGYILFPVGVVFHAGAWVVVQISIWVDIHTRKKMVARATAGPSIPVEAKEKEEYKPNAILQWVGDKFAKLVMFTQTVWPKVRKPVGFFLWILGTLCVLAAIGVAIYFITKVPLSVWLYIVEVIVSVAAGLVLIFVLMWLLLDYWNVPVMWKSWRRRRRDKRAIKMEHKGMSFRQVMKQGYVAVKTNTCPQIVIKE